MVGTENTPAACAYDIFGNDGESDGVGEHGEPDLLASGLGTTNDSFGGLVVFASGLVGVVVGDTG